MITVKLKKQVDRLVGMKISGHAGYAAEGEDIVCAAVTSAVRLCECTINDVIGAKAKVSVNGKKAEIDINLPNTMTESVSEECRIVLEGFKLHILALEEEYPQFIRVSEV